MSSPPDTTDHSESPGADSGSTRSRADSSDAGGTTPQLTPPVFEAAFAPQPERLGGFRIVRLLGRGGMGIVYEAHDERLTRAVALKVLNPELARRPDSKSRLLREAQTAAAVEHENVVPVLHVGEEGGELFIVMPLLKGESLADRLKRDGHIPPTDTARTGREIAAGLSAAHRRGLIHRDVKPGNVWLDADTGRARVLDFGLARSGDGPEAQADAHLIQGTPAYMAPEQLDGRLPDSRSDLFALGATLYECVTGRRAFSGPTVSAVLQAIREHHPEPPRRINPAVPSSLSARIMRLLEKDRGRRPAHAEEVATDLELVEIGGPIFEGYEKAPGGMFKAAPRSSGCGWVVAAAAVAALALAAAAVWLLR